MINCGNNLNHFEAKVKIQNYDSKNDTEEGSLEVFKEVVRAVSFKQKKFSKMTRVVRASGRFLHNLKSNSAAIGS